ncbi:MAG: hypothetical protein LUG85_08345, partial [Clostridiales bacterium]|nr:hypothetical protein [Clostridiales bacterium]
VIHWTSALLFMGVNPILILYAAIFKLRRKNGRYIAVMCVFAAAYFADIIYILTVFISTASLSGKNGIMEITPIFLTYFLLLIFNHSALLENEESRLHEKEYGHTKYAVN